jgi:putative cofactor-binding repeat protein
MTRSKKKKQKSREEKRKVMRKVVEKRNNTKKSLAIFYSYSIWSAVTGNLVRNLCSSKSIKKLLSIN